MATPVPDAFDPTALNRTLEWSKVLDAPAGKKRFQAVRTMLRDWLQETGRAPNAAKKHLSERLITSVGPSGSASKLPRELRQILGSGADDFAREVQTGYYFLTGKAPGGPTNAAFKNMLSAMQQAGMPPEQINVLRKVGPAKLVKMGGPGRAIAGLAEAQKDPGIVKLFQWAGAKVTGKAPAAKVAMPMDIAEAAAKFKPTGATISGLKEAGVKGLGAGTRALRGIGVLPTLAAGVTGYEVASTIKERGAEQQRASEMAATGVIPQELGGPAVVGMVDDKPVTAGQFLQMMREREDSMKLARFNAMTQEADLTRDVLSYLSGGEAQPQTGPRRIKLGSARPPAVGRQPGQDEVMKQFNALLRGATAGPSGQ